jgi:hypothetical protein
MKVFTLSRPKTFRCSCIVELYNFHTRVKVA